MTAKKKGKCVKWSKGRKRCLKRLPSRKTSVRKTSRRAHAAQKHWIFAWEGGRGGGYLHAATAPQAYAKAVAMGKRLDLVPKKGSVRQWSQQRDWAVKFKGVGSAARKGRCIKWSKGRKRCLKRAG